MLALMKAAEAAPLHIAAAPAPVPCCLTTPPSRYLDFEAMSEELAFLRRHKPKLLLTMPSFLQNALDD